MLDILWFLYFIVLHTRMTRTRRADKIPITMPAMVFVSGSLETREYWFSFRWSIPTRAEVVFF